MIREEAISKLKDILEEATEEEDSVCYVTSVDAEALEMAIEALEEQKTGKLLKISKTVNWENYENIIKNSPLMFITPGTEKIELIREQQWIPCSERLPEDDVEVFIYLYERSAPYIAWVEDCRWYTEDFEVKKENYPTAWMPLPELPEPYREEQQ